LQVNKLIEMEGESMERDFKGIWIPREVWLNKDLKAMEKLFLVEIDSLDNEEGCFAGNDYFSDFFGLSKNRCSEIIKSLEKKNLVSIDYKYKEGTKAIEKRIIRVIGISTEGIRFTDRGNRNIDRGYSENCEDNNTLSNNTINNTNNIYIPYSEIIDYLNKKANTSYRATGKKTKDLIKARFNEKFTFEDFKTVIDKKCNEWLNTKMENYLRPETLFSNKFEGYLNQKECKNNVSGFNKQDNSQQPNYNFSCYE
jgi:uncharacterized phage protein (TIGR02220 family)